MSCLTVKINDSSYINKKILSNVEFSVNSGELVSLCGRNGAGKSTLLSVIAQVTDSKLQVNGDVFLDEKKLSDFKRKELAQNIAYMEQSEYSTWDFSVYDFVLQGRFAHSKNGYYSEKDNQIVEEVLEELDITDFRERTIHNLSGGEFQKVRIARALAQCPQFMLLDEPSANLDFVYEPQLLEMLKKISHEKNMGIILSMHDVNMAAKYSDKMILLPLSAPVIFGKPEQIMTLENLQTTFGVAFERTDGRQLFLPRDTK